MPALFSGHRPFARIARLAVLIGTLLFVHACAPASDSTRSSEDVPSSTTSSIAPISEAPTTTESTSTTTTSSPETSLPGEPVDFGPAADDRVMVIGVSHEDFLNMREQPGTSFDVIAEIPPGYRELVALGSTRDIGSSFWVEVDYEGTTGWVHMGFVGLQGVTDDLTAYVVEQLGGRPTAESMAELGLIVSELLSSEDPPSELVMVTPETIGDVAEVTYDVIGLGDDSVRGLRVHLFAEPFDGGFILRTVEVTNICDRGVTADGLCT